MRKPTIPFTLKHLLTIALSCATAALWAQAAVADSTITVANPRDAQVDRNTSTNSWLTGYSSLSQGQIGVGDLGSGETESVEIGLQNSQDYSWVVPFDLPVIPPGHVVTSASLSFYVEYASGNTDFGVDVYGLSRTSTSSPLVLQQDWFSGPSPQASNLLIRSNAVTSGSINPTTQPSGVPIVISSGDATPNNLVTFLNQQYAAYGTAHAFTGSHGYVWLRFNANSAQVTNGSQSGGYYIMAAANHPDPTRVPKLMITTACPAGKTCSGGVPSPLPSGANGAMAFSFNLDTAHCTDSTTGAQTCSTSAGVFDTSTGRLVRTLWSGVTYPAGTHYANWDGLLDGSTAGFTVTHCQLSAGALPAGLAMSATPSGSPPECVVSGTPIPSAVSSSFTITATYSTGATSSADYTIKIGAAAPAGYPLSYPNTIGVQSPPTALKLSPTINLASGTTLSGCKILSGGSLPSGLTLNATSCVISGTPAATAATGSFTYTVQASAAPGATIVASNSFTIAIDPSFTVDPNAGSATIGTVYTLIAKGLDGYHLLWPGPPAPLGNYEIRVLYNNVTYNVDGVVGNTSADGASGSHVFTSLFYLPTSISITPTRAYYADGYQEGQPSGDFFNLDDIGHRYAAAMTFDYENFSLVSSDGTLAYFANNGGGSAPGDHSFVAAVPADNPATDFDANNYNYVTTFPYSHPGGTPTTYCDTNSSDGLGYNRIRSCLDFDSNDVLKATGLAVQRNAGGNFLFVAHGNLDSIHIFNKTTGLPAPVPSVTVTHPQGIVTSPTTGDLWVIHGPARLISGPFTIGSIDSSTNTITASGTPGWSTNQFQNATLMVVNYPNDPSGPVAESSWHNIYTGNSYFKVSSNTAGALTVTGPGATITNLIGTGGAKFYIYSWAASGNTSIERYSVNSSTGALTSMGVIAGGIGDAGAVAVSHDGSTVALTDNGPDAQIKAYSTTIPKASPSPLWTYGERGGLNALGPDVTDTRLGISISGQRSTALDFAPDDLSFWVTDPGTSRVLHVNAAHTGVVEQIAWNTAAYHSTSDRADPTRVFSGLLEYKVNYSLPLQGGNGSWQLVKNWAAELPAGYSAGGFTNVATLPNGRTYGILPLSYNGATSTNQLVELPSSGPLRIIGTTFDHTYEAAAIFGDGSLRFYQNPQGAQVVYYYSAPLAGYDSAGNPTWGPAVELASAPTANAPLSFNFAPAPVELTTSGVIAAFSQGCGDGSHLAGLREGDSDWLWRSENITPFTPGDRQSVLTSGNTQTAFNMYLGPYPQDGTYDVGNGGWGGSPMPQYCGSTVMAADRSIITGYHGEFWKQSETNEFSHYFDDGLLVRVFGKLHGMREGWGMPNQTGATPGEPYMVAGFAGNDLAPSLVSVSGTLYLYNSDESQHDGLTRWSIRGADSIQEIAASGPLGSVLSLGGGALPASLVPLADTLISFIITPANAPTPGPSASPLAGATFTNGDMIDVTASAFTSTDAITEMDLYDAKPTGTQTCQTATSAKIASFSAGTVPPPAWPQVNFPWLGVSAGTHCLTVVATDADKNSATSKPVVIHVQEAGATPGAVSGLKLAASGSSINLTWNASATTPATSPHMITFHPWNRSSTASNFIQPNETVGPPGYTTQYVNNIVYAYDSDNTGMSTVTFPGAGNTGLVGYPELIDSTGATVGVWLSGQGGMAGNGTLASWSGGSADAGYRMIDTMVGQLSGPPAEVNFVPYAKYELIVYSAPWNGGTLSTNVTTVSVTSGGLTSSASLTFASPLFTTYAVSSPIPLGTSPSAPFKNIDGVHFTGLTNPSFTLGGIYDAVQIVEVPSAADATSYVVQRTCSSATTVLATVAAGPTGTTSYSDTNPQGGCTYSVYAANAAGDSSAASTSNGASLNYSMATVTYTAGTAITPDTPTLSGVSGASATYAVSPPLPAGLTLATTTGAISGKPTADSTARAYTVTATITGAPAGSNSASAVVTIAVVDSNPPTQLTYKVNPAVYTLGTTITANSPAIAGGTPVSYTVSPTLPAGLTLSLLTGIITGKPTSIAPAHAYAITATDAYGSTLTASLTLTVNDTPPSALVYKVNPATYIKGVTITSNTPTSAGGAVLSYSIQPPFASGLGLSFNTTTGAITGTPLSAASAQTYVITATNSGGSATTNLSITVNDVSPTALTYTLNPATYLVGTAIAANSPRSSGGSVVGYSVAPALPTGLSLNATTGIITGSPTAPAVAQNYVVTANGLYGTSTNATLSIVANDPVLTYTLSTASYPVATAIAANSPNAGFSKFTITPALPKGLLLSATTGVISGTPTAIAAATTYAVTAAITAAPANTVTTMLSITVTDTNPPTKLTYTLNPAVYTKGVAITTNSAAHLGGAPVSYTVMPPLPAGLSLSLLTGVITGKPTVLAPIQNYAITASDTYGGSITATLTLTVNDAAPASLAYKFNPASYTKGKPVTADTPSNLGGAVVSYSMAPPFATALGLSFDPATGIITGTPLAVTSAQTYTVTATNSGGSSTATLSITVNDAVPSGLTYAFDPAVYSVSTPIPNNSPTSTGGAAVSYAVTPALPAGLSLSTLTGVLSGTPTLVTTAQDYTITATNTGGSITAKISITVNPAPVPVLTYPLTTIGAVGTSLSLTPVLNLAGVTSPINASNCAVATGGALPAGLTLNPSTCVISGTPRAVDTGTYSVTSVINAGKASSPAFVISINGAASNTFPLYTAWKAKYFTATELTNTAISGEAADPDHDGIPNLMEYALGLDPRVPNLTGIPVPGTIVINDVQYLTLTYTQLTGATDISYVPQVSTNMKTWNSGAAYVTQVSSVLQGTTAKLVTVRAVKPISSVKAQYIQLSIILNNPR